MRLAVVNLITRTPTRRKVPAIASNSDAMIVKLCRELSALGHDVDLYISDLYKPTAHDPLDLNVIYLPTLMRGLPELPCTPNLITKLRSGYDVVLLSEAFQWSTIFAVLSRLLSSGTPSAVFVWQELSVHQRTFRELPSRLFYKIVLRFFLDGFISGYIPRGNRAARFLMKQGIRASKILECVPHGVDQGVFYCDDHLGVGDYIFAPARLVSDKGIDVLLDAIRKVRDAGLKCRLIIQGDGPEADLYFSKALELDVSEFVTFSRDRVSHSEMRGLFSRALITVIASRRDFMLFSVMESLACGTPVLVSDAVDVADEIELFGGGVVFPNNDSDALAKALVEIISTPCVLARMRSEARTVSLRYRNDSVAKALVSRFSSVCDSRC